MRVELRRKHLRGCRLLAEQRCDMRANTRIVMINMVCAVQASCCQHPATRIPGICVMRRDVSRLVRVRARTDYSALSEVVAIVRESTRAVVRATDVNLFLLFFFCIKTFSRNR